MATADTATIKEKLLESRKLGEKMDRSGERVVNGLRKAASAARASRPKRSS